ncbi:Hypothetical predicted protein, partial [Paramuricea clavata]
VIEIDALWKFLLRHAMRITAGEQEDVVCPLVSITLGIMVVALGLLLPFPAVADTKAGSATGA